MFPLAAGAVLDLEREKGGCVCPGVHLSTGMHAHTCVSFMPKDLFPNGILFSLSSVAVGDADVSVPDGRALLQHVCRLPLMAPADVCCVGCVR